jgi:fibronectin type 3 domain-containing protein
MSKRHSNLIALREFLLAGFLVLLASCGGGADTTTTTPPPDNTPPAVPAVPTGLAATPGNASVALSWSASSGATSYHVKRATTSGGAYTQIAAPTTTTFSDTSLTNGTAYYYVVSALDSAGESANSTQASATPAAPTAIPAPPTNLVATAGNASVALSWSASSGATSYHVKRATASAGPYTQIAAPTSTTYSDSSLTNGKAYYYVVSALDSAGESANSASATATPMAPVPPTGMVSVTGLHVSGKQILNAQNQVVTLHGVDKSGAEYECLASAKVFDGPSDAASVAVLQTWDINIVRLPVNEDCWLGINGVQIGGTAYQTAIVNYVNLLTSSNIAAIVDLQWAAPGTTLSNQLTPMPDADHALAFWTSVANTFKGNSSVIFDLFNEPFPDNNSNSTAAWTCLLNGGTCPGVTYTAVGTQSMVNTIRATGSSNIIMVPGVQFTNVLDQWLAYKPTDPANQLAASWHSYANQICSTTSCWTSVIQPILAQAPLIAGEIGENDCQDIYINPLMTFLDTNGGSYLAWAWDTYDCSSFPSLISDYNGTPTAFGLGYYDHLLALNGQTPPPPPVIPFFSNTYPFGIAVGSSVAHTATDGTVYYPDVGNSNPGLAVTVMEPNNGDFIPFTTADTITGTSDPALYQTGRQGHYGLWTINVPNGNYVVTLGMAPNSAYNAGEFGQDQVIQGQKVGTCVWSTYSGTNISPISNTSCPQTPTTPAPALDVAVTVTYNVTVTNQMLAIEPSASFGANRSTMLNTIKVAQAP